MTMSIDEIKNNFPKYYKTLISDDTAYLKKQLKISSLFVLLADWSIECVQNYFIDFFTSQYKTNKNNEFTNVYDENYKEKVKEYSKKFTEIAKKTLRPDQIKNNNKSS